MSPLFLYNGKLLIDNNQLASNQNCCCNPPPSGACCTCNGEMAYIYYDYIDHPEDPLSNLWAYCNIEERNAKSIEIETAIQQQINTVKETLTNNGWICAGGGYEIFTDVDLYEYNQFAECPPGTPGNTPVYRVSPYWWSVTATCCGSPSGSALTFPSGAVTSIADSFNDPNATIGPIYPCVGPYVYDVCTDNVLEENCCGIFHPNTTCDPNPCSSGVCCQTSCGCTSSVTVTGLGAWGFDGPWEAGGFGAADYQATESDCPNLQGQNRCWNDTWEWSPNHLINDNYALIASGSAGQSSEPCDSALTFAGFSVSVYTRSDYDNGNLSNPVAYAHFEGSPEAIVPLPHTLSLSRDVCDSCGDINIVAEITETDCAEANRCDSTSTQAECEANGGTWHQGSTCEDNPCTSPNYCPTAGLECPPDCAEQCAVCFNVYCFGPGEGENVRGGFPCPGCPEGLTLVNGECVGISTSNNCDPDCSLIVAEKEPIFTAFFGGPRGTAWDSADEPTTIICNPLP